MMRKELYRDPINGKLTGVCAGLANYFSVEVWLVRIIAITFALLGGAFLVVVAYVAMTLMIEKQPKGYQTQWEDKRDHTLKSKVWQQGRAPSDWLATIAKDLDTAESRIQSMESYVTSDRFKFDREFSKL
ncbi:envelope stress response membrane protein PspC [Vibrio astriarenae]|uniref:Envelope stress response membrane protein PspC n=1 Tax=Vibrio astriarenae TaxID=1481923 RepID=A0A7Z2YDQ7_9VIBR|nr:envelope stress response membrane protein PspC [Vibrio astriarenae]QIA63587.1 envelope stress response membrane protein PspC [Vibrio astriarenae]